MILCGGSDSVELKSLEHDFKYLYWTISKILFWNLFTCKGTYIIDWVRRSTTIDAYWTAIDASINPFRHFSCFLETILCASGSFLVEKFPEPRPGFEFVTGMKFSDVTFSSQNVTFQVRCDAARFRKSVFSTSKNVTIYLELGTNVTISSYRHIIVWGSASKKPGFENLTRYWVPGAGFLHLG